jgi:hypothetical protein
MVSGGKEGTSGAGGKEGYQKEIREQVMRSISGITNGQERAEEKDSGRGMSTGKKVIMMRSNENEGIS